MVPDSPSPGDPATGTRSRRQVLASGGAAGALLGGGFLARRLLSTAAGSSTADVSPSDWPMAGRDPAGTGYAPEASPPTDGVTTRWEQPMSLVPDPDSRPAPVVANGVVYGVGGELLAASAADGSVVGRLPARSDTAPVVAPGRAYRSQTAAALMTPTFDPPRLIGFHGRGERTVAGLDADERRWVTPVEPVSDSYSRVHYGGGPRPPPIAAGDALVTFFHGTLAVVDASSGAVRWRDDENPTAVRPSIHDDTVYVPGGGQAGGDGGVIRTYDLESGDRATIGGVPAGLSSVVATADGLFAAGDTGLFALGTDGRVQWRVDAGDMDASVGPIAVGDVAVHATLPGEDGPRLASVGRSDGRHRWTSAVEPAPSGASLPAATDDFVCVPAADGSLAAVDAYDGSPLWRFEPEGEDERCSPAALADDYVFVLTNERLYALEEP